MPRKATQIYYSLSIFVWMTTFFVMHQSDIKEVAEWQRDMYQRLAIAWEQTIGDSPVFESVAFIYNGVDSFYQQTSRETVDLLARPDLDRDLFFVYSQAYNIFKKAIDEIQKPVVASADQKIPPNFMEEESIDNIIPPKFLTQPSFDLTAGIKKMKQGEAAGVVSGEEIPVNNETKQWVTIQDNVTGQRYCLAIYNGEINKYLGPCVYDYH